MNDNRNKSFSIRKKIITASVSVIICLLAYFGFEEGLKNKPDPMWFYYDTLLTANGFPILKDVSQEILEKHKIQTITDKFDYLKIKYLKFHQNDPEPESFESMMLEPFTLSWEYKKILYYFEPLVKNKRIVISGVTGSGKSTLVDRLSKMVSGSNNRILSLQCVEQMGVEYHREWIGYYSENGFVEGRLLKFFKQCRKEPNKNFVFILDDFDKIYPSTFFGSVLWSEMDSPEQKNYIQGYDEISIPDNFYLISVTHIGVANIVELNNEHFRRLGDELAINPDVNEFLLGIRERITDKKLNIPLNHIKKVVYFFAQANEYITKKYGMSYTLGQWATIRKKIEPEDWSQYIGEFVAQVNAFKPKEALRSEHFSNILYTINNDGLVRNSNFFYTVYEGLVATGIFSELTVGLAFAILSGIFGWLFIQRKRQTLNKFQFDVLDITEKFRSGEIDHESAVNEVYKQKELLENLILNRKIKYEESTFLLMYINDQLKEIEGINQVTIVSKDFEKILGDFMEDGVLDDDEYSMLMKFLENIHSALTPEVYYSLKRKIDDLRNIR